MTKSISLSFDADPFSQKVEGYEATGVNAKRSRGTFAGVKGHVATFLSLDACDLLVRRAFLEHAVVELVYKFDEKSTASV